MLTNIRLIGVQKYHKMAETGIFYPEERLELISSFYSIVNSPFLGFLIGVSIKSSP